MTSSAPSPAPDTETAVVPGAALVAEGLAVDGTHGVLLAPTSLRAVPGSVLLVAGTPGSGHTALALALAGRMRPDHGTVTLDGDDDPRRLRRAVARDGDSTRRRRRGAEYDQSDCKHANTRLRHQNGIALEVDLRLMPFCRAMRTIDP